MKDNKNINQQIQSLSNGQNTHSQNLKQKNAISTLQSLMRADKNNFIQNIENIAQRQRHGLFSQTPTLAIGDKYFDSKPENSKKNVIINPKLQDRVQPQLFSRLQSTNLGDPYKDNFRQKQLYDKQKIDMIPHSQAFLPSQNRKTIKNSQFEHFKQYQDKKYDTKDENGKIKTSKRNFSTNPMKRGFGATTYGHLFHQYQYMPSDYDAQRQKQLKQRALHKAKILAPFISNSHTKQVFNKDHEIFNKTLPQPYNQVKSQTNQTAYGIWKINNPSKKGYQKTFTKFPQYIQQGERQKPKVKYENIWRPNFNGTSPHFRDTLSKPCPVGSQLILNELRRQK